MFWSSKETKQSKAKKLKKEKIALSANFYMNPLIYYIILYFYKPLFSRDKKYGAKKGNI